MRQRRHRAPVFAAAIAVVAMSGWAVSPARAGATILVDVLDTSLGGGGCSLPEAILAANQDASTVSFDPGPPYPKADVATGCAAGAGNDVIVLTPGLYGYTQPFSDPGSHLGPAALPMIDSVITIEGRGAVLQRGANASVDFRLFSVGPAGDLDLREVHVKDFTTHGGRGSNGGGGGMGAGGAIFVDDGGLRVQWSTFEGNLATGGDGDDIFSPGGGGGGGGGIGGSGSFGSLGGGGGGGARGSGGDALAQSGAGGGGTRLNGGFAAPTNPFVGGYTCGGAGNDVLSSGTSDGFDANCPGGGGGGGADGLLTTGDGGTGSFGGGGGGGANETGNGGNGGFGGGGGAAGTSAADDGGGGGDAGFGGGGGAGPGGTIFGEPGSGGTFGGGASDLAGGGGAGLGGAIFGYRANIIVSNSTFTRNAAVRGVAGGTGARNGADAGGAIFAVGGSTTIVNTTIAGNETTGDGAGLAVYKPTTGESASLDLTNTIVAGNTGRDECFVLNGVTISGARNLIATHATDARPACPAIYLTADPQLGGLALNAPGRTPTMALSTTSPAIDEALDTSAPLDDQRGVSRPQGDYPDIGAYELVGSTPPPDVTGPTANPTVAPAANGNGWHRSAVTMTWNWADEPGGSGLDATRCPASSTSSGEGVDLVVAATCYDLAGNAGSRSVLVDVDATPPTAAPSTTPSPNAAGWNRADVTITWFWADAAGGSGLDAARCPSSSTSSGEGRDLTVAATCQDRADNAGTGTVAVDVDKTAPGVTCAAMPSYTLRGDHSANVTAAVSDGLSGPAATTVSADVSATDVSVAGPGSKSLTGLDVAGNETTMLCPFLVTYAFLGFQQPLPRDSVKAGSTIPVKFGLGDASGAALPDADAASMAATCLVQVTWDAVVQGCATYDPIANAFQRDIKTPKNATVGPHAVGIRVRVAGGTVVNTDQVTVQVRK